MPLPDQLQKGFTYADGDVVNAAGLNALVDQATAIIGTDFWNWIRGSCGRPIRFFFLNRPGT